MFVTHFDHCRGDAERVSCVAEIPVSDASGHLPLVVEIELVAAERRAGCFLMKYPTPHQIGNDRSLVRVRDGAAEPLLEEGEPAQPHRP